MVPFLQGGRAFLWPPSVAGEAARSNYELVAHKGRMGGGWMGREALIQIPASAGYFGLSALG